MDNTQQTIENIDQLSYEEARDALAGIVTSLEQGSLPLKESLEQWEKGEALAHHCQKLLDGARERLEKAQAQEEK
ncbi:MAG: exodeoxyribonuclease VII small subunit [Actinomycetaceae bacterium]|nr:exodeoxyribonuclease VII small subunit [Actinomycetaceae bacterium]